MADDVLADDACRPCRGTGRVISSLGGDPREVKCPWCSGSGVFAPDRDAQATGTELRAGAGG
jgi:DnaJ-class molecular chaperone